MRLPMPIDAIDAIDAESQGLRKERVCERGGWDLSYLPMASDSSCCHCMDWRHWLWPSLPLWPRVLWLYLNELLHHQCSVIKVPSCHMFRTNVQQLIAWDIQQVTLDSLAFLSL